jgi:hypothetical protein
MDTKVSSLQNIGRDRTLKRRLFGVLMGGTLLGVLAYIPYNISLIGLPPPEPIPPWLAMLIWLFQNLLMFAAAAGLGLWLGDKVGLGAPIIQAWLMGDRETSGRVRAVLPRAVGAGASAGAIIWLLEKVVFAPYLPQALQMGAQPPPWQGFLAAFYGGINEELLLRFGFMTLLVWLGTKLAHQESPSTAVMWAGIALAALLLGAAHLPMTVALAPLTTIVIIRTMLLNSIGGLVFGWLYWQQGLLAAMVAHFSADVVLHVVGAMIS